MRRGIYLKLMFAFAFMGVILNAYMYVVTLYTRDKIVFSTNVLFAHLYQDQAIALDYAGKPNYKEAAGANTNSSSSEIINVHGDILVPGQNAWIPHPVKRNPSGPFIIRNENGEAIKYTNYTFYPLTLNSSFLINNPHICTDTKTLTLLIMVHTAVPHFDRRKALRETWANPVLLNNHQSRTLFLVGRTRSDIFQKALEIESEKYKDIVQGDFTDDYHNLTHKGILGYRWITKYCKNAKFILKVDDDVFVNIFIVIHRLLPKYRKGQRIIFCHLLKNASIDRVGKFAVDPDYFPDYQRSPLLYCTGAFVLMPGEIVPEMYESAKRTPFYWVDDFYLFGILPNQVRNVHFHLAENVNNDEAKAVQCFQGENQCKYLAAYAWTQGVMYKYWDAILIMYNDLLQKYAMKV